MIRVDTLTIEHFRGIKDLTLDFHGKNFGICGPNGTGKSGVVDAIEFALRGDITRLSGKGAGDLSVSKHGPHVDAGEKSAKAKVTLTGHLSRIGKDVTITRSINKPSKPVIEPNIAEVLDEVAELQRHPEFALSRREIAKYIMTPASERSTDVQNLLRLSELDRIASALTRAANTEERAATSAKASLDQARRDVFTAVGLSEFKMSALLKAINERRSVLSLEPLDALTADSAIKPSSKDTEGKSAVLAKSDAKTDTDAFFDLLANSGTDTNTERESVAIELKALSADTNAFKAIRHQELVKKGLDLIDEDMCPLCDEVWDEADLRSHLRTKLESAKEAEAQIKSLKLRLLPFQTIISSLAEHARKSAEYAKKLKLDGTVARLSNVQERYEANKKLYANAFENAASLNALISHLESSWVALSAEDEDALQELSDAINALPDKSKEETAKEVLAQVEDRFRISLQRRSAWENAQNRAKQAATTKAHFDEQSTDALREIYDAVALDFSNFYRVLNHGDEDSFEGTLIPEPSKLTFDVDFYDRGKFPPGAFHSEGHQDGMGLCLYLALARHTLGDDFRFSVLDDVLMSVDTGHRRQVCRLLTNEFPNTQFILTTHDRVWLQYMRSEGLVRRSQSFSGWSVDTGPQIWNDKDVWTDIGEALDKEDVGRAAHLLRRYLEHIGTALCHGLRASVPFRADAKYDLGDLLPSGVSKVRKLLKEAHKCAVSWEDEEEATRIQESLDAFSKELNACGLEAWTVNPSVHYNEWANFEAREFKPVSGAYRRLLELIQCNRCGALVFVSKHDGRDSALSCSCGKINYRLIKNKR